MVRGDGPTSAQSRVGRGKRGRRRIAPASSSSSGSLARLVGPGTDMASACKRCAAKKEGVRAVTRKPFRHEFQGDRGRRGCAPGDPPRDQGGAPRDAPPVRPSHPPAASPRRILCRLRTVSYTTHTYTDSERCRKREGVGWWAARPQRQRSRSHAPPRRRPRPASAPPRTDGLPPSPLPESASTDSSSCRQNVSDSVPT